MKYIKELISFIQNVAHDPKIPSSDKKILLLLLALIISPIDLIPDWIPVIGLLDDFIMLGIVLDYFFNHLDHELLLSHFPWSLKAFIRLRRLSGFITFFTPSWIKNKIWTYKPSVYKNI